MFAIEKKNRFIAFAKNPSIAPLGQSHQHRHHVYSLPGQHIFMPLGSLLDRHAIQDLVRVSAQRRLGDHETRLRVDVAGYRERRAAALATFARSVADDVRSSGSARSMEPMNSADRKVIHDALNDEDGVDSRSEGEDPDRRIVVVPID